MAKKASPTSSDTKSANDYPSATLIAALERLRHERASRDRRIEVWFQILHGSTNSDFPVLLDFAMEHELVFSLETPMSHHGSDAAQYAKWVNPVDHSEMIWIPSGPTKIGAENKLTEMPGFSLARHPVTNEQFLQFIEESGYEPSPNDPEREQLCRHWTGRKIPKGDEKKPVTWVSYLDALHYCAWAGLTLPTEWMWEKAARGPEGRIYPWGNEMPKTIRSIANISSNRLGPIGKYSRTRSPYGCEDLIGNVFELCQTTQEDRPIYLPCAIPSIPTFPDGTYFEVAIRGGCFSPIENMRVYNMRLDAACRRKIIPTRRSEWLGFRPACPLNCRPI